MARRSGRSRPVEIGLLLCSQFPVGDDAAARFDEQLEQVRFVRDAGFDSVFASQHYLAHPFQYLHPIPVLSRVLAEAGDMRIGTSIALLALPSPVDIAEQLATLDVMSGGRLTVGVGLGYRDVEFDAFGIGEDGRLRRFLDNLDVVRQLWSQDEVTFHAQHVSLDKVPVALRPVQRPHPPIWMAGHTDAAIRRAARRGLPWVAAAAHVDDTYLRHQVKVYRDACREFGHDLDLPMAQEIYVAPTEEQALSVVRRSLGLKYQAYQQWGQDSILPADQSFDVEFDELRQGRFIIGDPEQCTERILRLVDDIGPTHLILRMQWPGMPQDEVLANMRLFTTEVMPALERAGGKDRP
jgi:alkanesulfonate monooxygenase SsuD/methylene tetrahydromethanopterin reductase-like flavin-dependent oxidoreductase (luciferase family)